MDAVIVLLSNIITLWSFPPSSRRVTSIRGRGQRGTQRFDRRFSRGGANIGRSDGGIKAVMNSHLRPLLLTICWRAFRIQKKLSTSNSHIERKKNKENHFHIQDERNALNFCNLVIYSRTCNRSWIVQISTLWAICVCVRKGHSLDIVTIEVWCHSWNESQTRALFVADAD